MADEQSISYDELLNDRPQVFAVDRHQSFADTGVILVSAPPAIDGLVLEPGQQLNYVHSNDEGVTAYSVGPVDADDDWDEDEPDDDRPAPEDGHPCEVCDFVAKTAAGLGSHMRSHDDE